MKPTLEGSPMPTHTMNSGSMASGGIGRSSSTIGSTTLRTGARCPAARPSADAEGAPVAEAEGDALERGAPRGSRAGPCRPAHRAPSTSQGPGRKTGLNSRRTTTTPETRLHSARKAASRRAGARARGRAAARAAQARLHQLGHAAHEWGHLGPSAQSRPSLAERARSAAPHVQTGDARPMRWITPRRRERPQGGEGRVGAAVEPEIRRLLRRVAPEARAHFFS